MEFNSIILDSRLKGLSIESKNEQMEVRTRNLWSFKVEASDFAWVCKNVRDSPCKMSATWNNF